MKYVKKKRNILIVALLVLSLLPFSVYAEETASYEAAPDADTAVAEEQPYAAEDVFFEEITADEAAVPDERSEESDVPDTLYEPEETGESIPETEEADEPFSESEEEELLSSADETAAPSVIYSTHVQTYGWMNEASDGSVSGTVGKSKRLEAIKIRIEGDADLGVTYQTHVQTYGWLGWKNDNAPAGTEGQSKRLEAIRIQLTGSDKDKYDIYYCVHVQTYGWMNWVKNGELAGTEGQSKRLEGICIMLVKKGDPAPWYPGSAATETDGPAVLYRVHVQTYGWMSSVMNGVTAGTEGQSKRLEALTIELKNAPYEGSIQYRTHVQTYGWETDWRNAGEESGTTGQGKRLEALQIRLTGEMAEHYDVYYRTHVQRFGWLGWAKNGESAGSEGYSFRMESMQIRLVPKGGDAPGSTANAFRSFNPPQLDAVNSAAGGKSITTFGGYTLSDSLRSDLQKAIDTARDGKRNIGFLMVDIRTGQGVAYNPDEQFYSASTIKAPYVASLVFREPSSIDKWGGSMKAALEQSNNFAYTTLRKTYGTGPLQTWAAKAGINDSRIWKSDYVWYTPKELAKLWLVNYTFFESGGNAGKVASWLQNPNRSLIRPVLGSKYTVLTKAGWKSAPEAALNDAGIVYAENGPYVLVIMTDYPGSGDEKIKGLVEALDACHRAM